MKCKACNKEIKGRAFRFIAGSDERVCKECRRKIMLGKLVLWCDIAVRGIRHRPTMMVTNISE